MAAWNAYNTVVCWQLTEDDISPIFTPLYHAGGLGAFWYAEVRKKKQSATVANAAAAN